MPKRINAEIDMQILADIGLGMLYKNAAIKYNVSPSYISKLASGKKIPDIYVTPTPTPEIIKSALSEDSIADVIKYIEEHIELDDKTVENYLKQQISNSTLRIKLFSTILNKYKGGK